jgi:cbb3-type cytochrome oxidase cytochrome c subunit
VRTRVRADRRIGVLLGGVVLLAFVAIATTIILPATDPAVEAKARDLTAQQVAGMKVYRAEGCWYCHTGYVRETAVDTALGKPLDPKAYGGTAPSMLGLERIGPDLTHVDARFANGADLAAYLADPAKNGHHTSMPNYGYLSDRDLEALAAYLLSRSAAE